MSLIEVDEVANWPVVHVRGDVATMWLVEADEQMPDSFEDGLAPYRSVENVTFRELAAGAWLVRDFVAGALANVPPGVRFWDLPLAAAQGNGFSYQLKELGENAVVVMFRRNYDFLGIWAIIDGFTFNGKEIVGKLRTFDGKSIESLKAMFGSAQRREPVDLDIYASRWQVTQRLGRRSKRDARVQRFVVNGGESLATDTGEVPHVADVPQFGWSKENEDDRPHRIVITSESDRQSFELSVDGVRCFSETIATNSAFGELTPPPQSLAKVITYPTELRSSSVHAFWRVSPCPSFITTPSKTAMRLRGPHGYDVEDSSDGSESVALSKRLQNAHRKIFSRAKRSLKVPNADEGSRNIFVFQDLNFGFRRQADEWTPLLDSARNIPDSSSWIITILGRALPTLSRDGRWSDNDPLWQKLSDEHSDRTMVIVSAQLLRASGIRISHRVSWERTAQDCLIAAYSNAVLKKLAEFSHLVIRIGVCGAVHIYRLGEHSRVATVYFDPVGRPNDAFFRNPIDDGRVVGNNSAFAAAIIRSLVSHAEDGLALPSLTDETFVFPTVEKGIRDAIVRCQRLHDLGYDWPPNTKGKVLEYTAPKAVFTENLGAQRIAAERIRLNPTWSILEESAREGLLPVAMRIVEFGLDRSVNCPDEHGQIVQSPVLRFGEFLSVEREEIESYRHIERIIRDYSKSDIDKPLSLAVFGPPGSGKSFGVECVAKRILGKDVKPLVCNLSQLTSPADLGQVFVQAIEPRKKNEPSTPVVFFDEFDCQLGDKDLGWLRYFLAPMEDGKYKHGADSLRLGKAVFVFAGGTSRSFLEFSRDESVSTEQERFKFALAKGPDFVSRLSGHINTIGINPRSGTDQSYFIRRAIQLRGMLEKRGLISPKPKLRSLVQPTFLAALLRVREFRHGSRSMRIVFNSSVDDRGVVQLPAVALLNMHVDGEQLIAAYDAAIREGTHQAPP